MPGSTVLLSAILAQIGALEHLQTFIMEGDDDLCIASYRRAERVKRDFGLPLELASKFVDMCRAVNIIQRAAQDGSRVSGRPTVLLSAILEEISAPEYLEAFIKEGEDDLCIAGYRRAERISRDFNLPAALASSFVSMCSAVHLIQSNPTAMSQITTPRVSEVVVFQPPPPNSTGSAVGAGGGGQSYTQQRQLELPAPTSHPQQPKFVPSQSPSHQSPASEADDTGKLTAKVAALFSENTKAKIKSFFKGGARKSRASRVSVVDDVGGGSASNGKFVPGLSDLQVAVHSNAGALPLSCSQYTVTAELTNAEFIVFTQQLMVVPPNDSICVACCHRLPPKIRQHVRLGSRIVSLSLLDYKNTLIQEWDAPPSFTFLKSIPAQYAWHTVKIVFVATVVPLQAPFILPDAYSDTCMKPTCMAPFTTWIMRNYCRCCGLLFCSECCNKEMPLPNYSTKKAHVVCDICHELFARSPDKHWTPTWVLQKRREAFFLATEQLTNALDLIEKRPHAQRLGLDVERLWKADDPEFKQAKLQLNKSHPDAVGVSGADASQSAANFTDIKNSCFLLVDWLSAKETQFHEIVMPGSPVALFDESCKICNRKFGPVGEQRKHYCRICGHSICGRISSCFKKDGKCLPASFGFGSSPVSVCLPCDQHCPVPQHPFVLSPEGYIDYFARLVDEQQEELRRNARKSQGYLAPLYMSRLHVVASVDVSESQLCRVSIFFSSSIENPDTVASDLGRLKCTVTRKLESFDVLRKCLLAQGYAKEIVPELNSKIKAGPSIFLNSTLQHRRLRNSPLIPLFCTSSDSWEDLRSVMSKVAQGADSHASEIVVRTSPAMLPWAAILELLNVLSLNGLLSLWGPLIIKFFSIAQFRTEAEETNRRYEDRLSSFQARSKRYLERTSQAQRFEDFFQKTQLALKDLLNRSLERLSRERTRLANQRSSVFPVFTRRQHDLDERKTDWEWYLVCLEQFKAESQRFETEALASQQDSASCERLLTDCVTALESANKVQSSHHDWMFESLSSLKLGNYLPAIIPAIKELEEQLSTMSKKNRDDLAEERAQLEQQRAALSQEVNMNTVETPESQFFYVQSFKTTLDQFQTSVKCEEADIISEAACRSDKIARIKADIVRVEEVISKTEAALEQRVTKRQKHRAQISSTIVSVTNSSDQCRSTVPLLQSALSETKSADESVRERIALQTSTIIVLKKMKDALHPLRTGILQRCEQAAQFVSLQANLINEVANVLSEAQQELEHQLQEVWALPLDFAYQATAMEKGDIDSEDLEMAPFKEKRAEFEIRVRELMTAYSTRERQLCEEFQQHIEVLSSALNTLQHVDVKAVSSELSTLNACIASWGVLFEEERTVNEAAKQAAITRVTNMFDRLSDLQHQASVIFGEQTAWIEEIQQKCSNNEAVLRSVTLHTELEIRIRAASTNISDLRRQVDGLIMSAVTNPRTVQLNWNAQLREMQSAVELFERNYEQEKANIDRNIQAALAYSSRLGQETLSQRLERLEVLSNSIADVVTAISSMQLDSKQAQAKLPSSSVIDDEFLIWFNDRCSQAHMTQVPLVQSAISRAQTMIVDGSEQQFLSGIERARKELSLVLPNVSDLHARLSQHNDLRRRYFDVASAVLDNLANERNVYLGVDYTSLTHATHQLLGQAATLNPLPVPYVPLPE